SATNPNGMDHCELFFEVVDESPDSLAQDPLSSSSSIPFDRVTGVTASGGDGGLPKAPRPEMDYVEVAGEDISPEECTAEAGWLVSHQQRGTRALNKLGPMATSTAKNDAGGRTENRKPRQRHRKQRQQPALPREDIKVPLRPLEGLDVTKSRRPFGVAARAAGERKKGGREIVRAPSLVYPTADQGATTTRDSGNSAGQDLNQDAGALTPKADISQDRQPKAADTRLRERPSRT
ncbi:hypothetical protein HPB47_015571, partial [Ixodes persulcatus]